MWLYSYYRSVVNTTTIVWLVQHDYIIRPTLAFRSGTIHQASRSALFSPEWPRHPDSHLRLTLCLSSDSECLSWLSPRRTFKTYSLPGLLWPMKSMGPPRRRTLNVEATIFGRTFWSLHAPHQRRHKKHHRKPQASEFLVYRPHTQRFVHGNSAWHGF